MSLTHSEYISLGSLGVSCIATFLAFRSLRNSSSALAIAKGEQIQKERSLGVYLVEARKIKMHEKEFFAAFTLSYTNTASVPNTMSRLELIVYFTDDSEVVRETFLSAHEKMVFPEEKFKFRNIELPLNIPPRSSVTGCVAFKFPDYLRNKTVKKYEIVGFTSDSQRVSVECFLLMDTYIYEKK